MHFGGAECRAKRIAPLPNRDQRIRSAIESANNGLRKTGEDRRIPWTMA